MAHDVFLSHSAKNKTVADAMCAVLESARIRCWVAPRDVRPGATWADAITVAIRESRAFVLIFSSDSNDSPQVLREVDQAVKSRIPIIPFRIDETAASAALDYYIRVAHWLDALTPPLSAHLNRLCDTLKALPGLIVDPAPGPAPDPAARGEPSRRRLLVAGGLLATGGIGALALVRYLSPDDPPPPPPKFPTAPPQTFAPNTVDETWKKSNEVWISNVEGRILAISTVCTHLGCTPNWSSSESKFKCPCHGSGYYMNGVNFEGPAPRPLERFALSVNAADGNLWVDKTRKCQVEQGTCDDPAFFING